MLFRNTKGELIEINKNDHVNDILYYQKIMKLKTQIAKSNILKKTFHDKQQ